MLGGVIGARGDDLSGPDAASDVGVLPSWDGVLPRLPENWSDLPLRLKVSESVGHNSNVLNSPTNIATGGVLSGLSRGDFQSLSTYGASTKANWSGQQLFMDGSVGLTRYLHDVSLNSIQYAVDAGVNWNYTSRCSGTLVAAQAKVPSIPGVGSSTSLTPFGLSPSTSAISTVLPGGQIVVTPLGQQVGFGFINFVTATSFNETAKCLLAGDYAAIFNSGITQLTNSTVVNRLNNSRSVFVSAGVSYSVTATNSLEALVTVTGTDFPDRQAVLNNTGLVNNITQDQFNIIYTREFGPNLSAVASIGAVGVNNSAFSLALPSGIMPQYAISVSWIATPKVTVTASAARTVAPPTAVIGNAQISDVASLRVGYMISPKVLFSASVARTLSSSAFTQLGGAAVSSVVANSALAQNAYTARAGFAYTMTPFLSADLSYQYTRTDRASLITPQSLVMLDVNYSPY